jgi:hypothetical protein
MATYGGGVRFSVKTFTVSSSAPVVPYTAPITRFAWVMSAVRLSGISTNSINLSVRQVIGVSNASFTLPNDNASASSSGSSDSIRPQSPYAGGVPIVDNGLSISISNTWEYDGRTIPPGWELVVSTSNNPIRVTILEFLS